VLKGFDAVRNVVLSGCKERVFSAEAGVEIVELGLYVVRGDSMCVPAAVCAARPCPCTREPVLDGHASP
jgi:U6 snRNA-associated Sm-like protein LSm8